jgi:AcrR family transcriptional regulator
MRDGAATKAKISRTALKLFVKQGVTATTIRDIATAAGVSEGALYRHYESKDALAWDLFATHFTTFARELDELQAKHSTLRAKLDAMIRYFCTFFDRDRTLFSYLLLSQHGQLEKVTSDMNHPADVFRKAIAGGMARKEIPKADPEVATAMVMGLVLQVALTRVYGVRITQDLSRLAETLVAAAWRVLTT